MEFSGAILRETRLLQAMTQADLAAASGVSMGNIHKIEAGRTQPRPGTVRKLATTLGVEPRSFFVSVPPGAGKNQLRRDGDDLP